MQKKSWMRPVIFSLMVGAVAGFYLLGGSRYLTLDFIQKNLDLLRANFFQSPIKVTSSFIGVYLFLTALSIPGSILLTLLSGALFGLALGTFWTMFCTTTGACLSFLLSRYFFRDYFSRKFHRQYRKMNHRVKQEGIHYLFTLRMIPASPYVVINVVMGLTEMRLFTFAWVTLLGMLPGTFLYILAGKRIVEIRDVSDIISWELGLALSALALFPPTVRCLWKHHSQRLMHE